MIVLVINALLQVYPAWAIGVNHRGSPPNQWRTQDFRIEGVEAPRGVGRGYPPTQIFFVFFLFKTAYFDAFWHANGGSNPPNLSRQYATTPNI